MDQRASIMLTAIIFAIVVAGSIAYLIYSNPTTPSEELSATATPAITTPTPTLFVIATPKPTLAPAKAVSPTPMVSRVSATAPTGSPIVLTGIIALLCAASTFSLLYLAKAKA